MNRLKEKYSDDKEFITNVTQCNIRYDTIVSTGVTGFFKDKQYYSTFKDVLQENNGQSYLQMLRNTSELTFSPPVFVVLPKFDYPHSREGVVTNSNDRSGNSDSNTSSGNKSMSSPSGNKSMSSPSGNRSVSSPSGNRSMSSPSGNKSMSSPSGNKSMSTPSGGGYSVASIQTNTPTQLPINTSYDNASNTPSYSQSRQSTNSSQNYTFNPYGPSDNSHLVHPTQGIRT